MKLTLKHDDFQRAFMTAATVAPSRSPREILQNVKLQAEGNQLILTATDGEVGIRLVLPDVQVHIPGSALIPVHRLSMILRETSDEELVIEATPERTLIEGRFSRFDLQAQNADEFPAVKDFSGDDAYEMTADDFRDLIRRTIFATDTESSRFALGGVLLEFEGDHVTAVGTDGRRLAKMEKPIKVKGQPLAPETSTIVPARSMQLMERIMGDGDIPVYLIPQGNHLLMKFPNGVFYTTLVEGRFPKWRDVIPRRPESTRIDIPVGPTYAAVRQAAVVVNDESRGIDFNFTDGTLVLTSSVQQVGKTRVEMPVSYAGAGLTISLDNRFISDFLKVLPPEKTFTLEVESPDQAAHCKTDDNYDYIVMPMSKEQPR
ncbi:MAG TPA: DNA polymerase III subunit beta [Pirellulaceae bacterium]|nr:DNA polymerase III subunit beta [Pirellulaceae bacterium]